MSIFCKDKCKCKRRCKADLSYNKEALKGCKAACKTASPPVSGADYLSTLPAQARILIDKESMAISANPSIQPGPSPLVMILFSIAALLLFYYLK